MSESICLKSTNDCIDYHYLESWFEMLKREVRSRYIVYHLIINKNKSSSYIKDVILMK